MDKLFAAVIAVQLLLSGVAAAQDKSVLPLYGSAPKTDDEKRLDEKFVRDVIGAAGSAQKAADHLMKRGWEAIGAHDADAAMRRFNQVYLLTPDDYRVYWGIGAALGMKKDFPDALEFFDEAERKKPKEPRLLCDHGFALVAYALSLGDDHFHAIPKLIEADGFYRRAIEIDPKLALSYSRLAVLMYYKGDLAQAQELVRKSRQIGGEGLDPAFEHDLARYGHAPERPLNRPPLSASGEDGFSGAGLGSFPRRTPSRYSIAPPASEAHQGAVRIASPVSPEATRLTLARSGRESKKPNIFGYLER